MKNEILKAYFDTNLETNNPLITDIIKTLNKEGCNVIQSVVGTDFSLIESSHAGVKNIYNSKTNEITDADFVVIEMSKVSVILLALINDAINLKKPVLILINKTTASNFDKNFIDSGNNTTFIELYTDSNINDIVSSFISNIRKKLLTTRFTVRLTEEHTDTLEYLKYKWKCASRNEVITKLLEREFPSSNN